MTNDKITELALANGFKLKPQCDDGENITFSLNPYVLEFAHALLQADALAKASDGWKLAPLEPTVAMAQVKISFPTTGCQMGEIYRAMLDAAPQGAKP